MKLYYDLISQPCRALYIVMKAANIDFEAKHIDIRKGENQQMNYARINRFRKVPVLDHDGFLLTESVAILRYLCRENMIPDSFFPKDSKAHARVDEFLCWQHVGLRLPCTMYFRIAYLEPLVGCVLPAHHMLMPYFQRMEEALTVFETQWLGCGPYILGDQPTVADILAACEIEQTKMTKYELPEKFHNTITWLDKVKKYFNPIYKEAHTVVDEIVKYYI